jgi:two-component system, LytTR family, response regulator
MKIRALIVDDEPLARQGVRSFLASEPDVEVVGECSDGAEAVKSIGELRPALVFLDVQMPRLNGFKVLEALPPDQIPVVIFTTAHDEHAIRAFEVNAVDYLLKPFKPARFRKALQRARALLDSRATPGADPQIAALLATVHQNTSGGPRILVKTPDRILFLQAEEVDHIEAAGNYLVLHTAKERHIVRDTMTDMEARLAPAGFMRISRSIIVNLDRIRELQPMAAGEFCVILKTGARLNMTCSLGDLQERMRKL